VDIVLTTVFEKVAEGYIGYVPELPGANSQGVTLEETRANLAEAIWLVLLVTRDLAQDKIRGREVIRESVALHEAR
jgi:predicted RNase H-like HicB family nuclease